MSCCPHHSRRHVLAGGAALALLPSFSVRAADALPSEVAGIAIPRSPIALKAVAASRVACPDFLFNHCMRTYLFGALFVSKLGKSFDAEQAFVAAAFHDFGLLTAFESPHGSFEIDGANNAEKFAKDSGLSARAADNIWHSVVFHDWKWAVTQRQSAEAMVVSSGAGADVDGPGDNIDPKLVDEVIGAFPRLQFKKRFTDLAISHCKRKPQSQRATWLEGLCREQVPGAFKDTVEQEIASAPFAE